MSSKITDRQVTLHKTHFGETIPPISLYIIVQVIIRAFPGQICCNRLSVWTLDHKMQFISTFEKPYKLARNRYTI